MKVEILTVEEAKLMGITHSRLLHEGHGAFGESDNTYTEVVYIGNEVRELSEDDLIIFCGESPNRKILQVIRSWDISDRLAEILLPNLLEQRKANKYNMYLKLREELENDKYYKNLR